MRSAVSQRGHVHAASGLVAAVEVVSVSLSGCLVESEVCPPLFARVQLSVPVLRGRPLLQGQIVRHTERGFAIEWSNFPDTGVLALLARAPPVRAGSDEALPTSRASPRRRSRPDT
jgi:hypothetical protein